MRKLLLTLAAGAAPLLAAHAPAAAQTLELRPRIGAFVPASDLGSVNGDLRKLDGSLALGLSAEFKLPVLPRLRVGFDYATDTKVSFSDGVGSAGSGGVTLLASTVDLVLRPAPILFFSPYALVGAGLKRYNIDKQTLTSFDLQQIFDRNQSDFAAHLGLGADFRVGPLALTAELSDYISSFRADSGTRLQHDLFGMAGLSVIVF